MNAGDLKIVFAIWKEYFEQTDGTGITDFICGFHILERIWISASTTTNKYDQKF